MHLQGGPMSSIISKDIFFLSLSLLTLSFFASCASSTNARSLAEVTGGGRSPEGDYRSGFNKENSRQFVREKN